MRYPFSAIIATIVVLSLVPAHAQVTAPIDNASARLRAEWKNAFTRLSQNRSLFSAERIAQIRQMPPSNLELALASVTAFSEPASIRSVNRFPLRAELTVKYAENVIGTDRVWLRSYNGRLVGPTLRVRPGDTMKIVLKNRLPREPHHHGGHNQIHGFNTTNLHTHGLHVSPKGSSDNVLLRVEPGQEFRYTIKIPNDHPAGTFWYHAHSHGSVAGQVSSGMSGALIVEGGLDNIEEIKAAKERIFVFQQIPYVLEDGVGVVEARYADKSFGPGKWDELGRYTTINGTTLPVVRMSPGELQRWRFIHSGVREGIGVQLQRFDGDEAVDEPVTFNQIAMDGLALGGMRPLDVVGLFPGYRSDVLVRVKKAGTYLLMDVALPNVSPLTQNPQNHPKYLAKVIVDGPPKEMPLPKSADLKPAFGSLRGVKINETQSAEYRIVDDPPPLRFEIDGRSFDGSHVRTLTLGNVEEWTLKSVNPVGPVDHPFHIHVNPFEVISAIDEDKNEHPEEYGWRDTLLLRHNWTYKVRTHYRRFTGRFVQHCHILDHEDLGMMELVEIVRKAKD